ncbi:MAG: acyltransferase [Prevotellaceae bacterium]|jgi:hypothetical protein|nr:acyltransferase [Prevotellaceae bacterium]
MDNIQKIVAAIDARAKIDNSLILRCFDYQYRNCEIYRRYVDLLEIEVTCADEIPFLPVEYFKTHSVYSANKKPETEFTSSGTTGEPSRHFVAEFEIYRKSFTEGFRCFFGDISNFAVLALLPSYLERSGSSLIAMVQDFIDKSNSPFSGFFLREHDKLFATLMHLKASKTPVLLIGVSFALLDFIDKYTIDFPDLMVMETGGMKGRREEITRSELHEAICQGFGVERVFSEYGMTELLSQAYSYGNGRFRCPPWMKILIRDPKNPLKNVPDGVVGGINIIDLANIYSCSFIETRDLGIMHSDSSFEIVGRFDESEIRGCNLMC